jgi:hypothetical protein
MTETEDKRSVGSDKFRIWRLWTVFCSLGEIFGILAAAFTARLIWLLIGEPAGFA